MSSLSSLLRQFAELYPTERVKKYASSDTTSIITEFGPKEIIEQLGINTEQFKVYGSVGIGGRSDIPWIAILDKDITTTTKNGYYVVILLDKETQFVNIGLGVGFTQFKEEYKNDAKVQSESVCAHYAKLLNNIPNNYIKGRIQLGATTTLGKGYEYGQIISINHQINDLTDDIIYKELRLLLGAYQELKEIVGNSVLNLDVKIIESDNLVYEFKKEIVRKSFDKEAKNGLEELIERANTEPPKVSIKLKKEIIRNRRFADHVKERANYTCEICGRLPFKQKNGSRYAEADHIEQLGGKIKGKDSPDNMMCLCSQCHSIITHGDQSVIETLLKI